jgi:hypothetical protein
MSDGFPFLLLSWWCELAWWLQHHEPFLNKIFWFVMPRFLCNDFASYSALIFHNDGD